MRRASAAPSGRRREDHVPERLGQDAAQAQHHAGAELRVAHQAGDQLAPAAHHLGDEQLHLTVLGAHEGQQLARRLAHGPRVREPETDGVALGLVGDAVATQLDGDRKAHVLRGPDGAVRVACQRLRAWWECRKFASSAFEACSESVREESDSCMGAGA